MPKEKEEKKKYPKRKVKAKDRCFAGGALRKKDDEFLYSGPPAPHIEELGGAVAPAESSRGASGGEGGQGDGEIDAGKAAAEAAPKAKAKAKAKGAEGSKE